MIDRESVRNHHKRYRKGGLMALLRNEAGGSECALNDEQRQQLADYLQSHLCLTAKQVAHYVQQTWQVTYSERRITQRLHRLGFVYKKPKLIPGKADAERQRLNINGVIDCSDLNAIVRYDDTINAQSTIKLFQQIELQNPDTTRIHIICDNARYYHAQLVKDYLADSKIELVFLPPYAPNLNLIERFWKFFKKSVLYGRYYETFCQFKTACDDLFAGLDEYNDSLRSLLTDRFQIIGQG